MKETKRTPGPWTCSKIRTGPYWQVKGPDKIQICKVSPRSTLAESVGEANAAFIVRACNHFESVKLLAKKLVNKLDHMPTDDFAHGGEREEREALRAALTTAEKGE